MQEIRLSKKTQKDLIRVPFYIATALQEWVDLVEEEGLSEARRCKGYHDEPCKGKRKGQRSIRLSRAYRAFYQESEGNVIEILEVNKHDY